MKKVLIITDQKWRDLAGYVYLKFLLERKGNIKVRLCRLGEDRFWVLHDKPDLIIHNHLYEDRKVKFAYWLKKQNIGIIILPTENMPLRPGVEDLFAGKFTDLTPVDFYLSWNEQVAHRIIELGKLPPEKVKIIGVPRFDFYYPPLTRLFAHKETIQKKYGLAINKNAPVVLYATNFTIASFNDNKSFLYKDWNTLKLNRIEGYKPEQIKDRIRLDTISRDLTIQSVKQLLQEFPDVQIIYKPHPSENHAFYTNVIKELKRQFPQRFAFVVQEYIWDLLNVSDVILQRTCTTAIEAWMLGKPTIELHLHPDEFYFSEEHAHGSDIAYNYDDLKQYINYYAHGGKIANSIVLYRNVFLKKLCYKTDGRRTIEVAEIITQFLNVHEKARYSFSLHDFISLYPKEYGKQLYRYIRNFIRKRFIGTDKLGRIDKQFMKKDVKFWEERISSVAAGDFIDSKL